MLLIKISRGVKTGCGAAQITRQHIFEYGIEPAAAAQKGQLGTRGPRANYGDPADPRRGSYLPPRSVSATVWAFGSDFAR